MRSLPYIALLNGLTDQSSGGLEFALIVIAGSNREV